MRRLPALCLFADRLPVTSSRTFEDLRLGVLGQVGDAVVRVLARVKVIRHKLVFRHKTLEDRFTAIYRFNMWQSAESVSGGGSEMGSTQDIRRELPGLMERLGVRALLDVPCGDFHWMRHVVAATGIDYTGGDIVAPLIERLEREHGSERVRFRHIDLTTTPLPKADMIMVRDCLIHLSYANTKAVLENFLRSEISYFAASTNVPGTAVNRDITNGSFRAVDLFAAPYRFPAEVVARIPDRHGLELCVWSREQVRAVVEGWV